MKNLILALLSLTITNHVYASTICNDGTQAMFCEDHGGYPLHASADVVDPLDRSEPEPEPEVIVVTGRRDESPVCTGNISPITAWACEAEDDCGGYDGLRLSYCNRLKTKARGRLRTTRTSNLTPEQQETYDIMFAASEFDCSAACPSAAPAAAQAPAQAQPPAATADGEEFTPNTNPSRRFANGGADGELSASAGPQQCLRDYNDLTCDVAETCRGSDQCKTSNVVMNPGQQPVPFTYFKPVAESDGVNFENISSCQKFFGQTSIGAEQSGVPNFQLTNTAAIKAKLCRLVAASCPTSTPEQRRGYVACVNGGEETKGHLRAVVVGMKKCAAVKTAGLGTTEFESDTKVSSMDGKISCKKHDGTAFDYPSCKSFVGWYNGLVAAQTGVQMYNEGDKISTGMRAQNDAAQAVATGNGQEAGIEASRKTINASASAEERSKLFFIAKGAAITAQLVTFVDSGNIEGQCEGTDAACCELFDSGAKNDAIKNAESYFPNKGEKDKMIAEVIRAGGEAALAAMKEQELRRQAAALKAIKDQMTAPDDLTDEGVMKFCLQFPQDQKCLGPGNRVVSGGAAFRGPSFNGQNMGLGNFGEAASEDLAVDGGGASAVGGPDKSIGDIGSTDKGAMDAKAAFDAPSALRGGGGSFNSSGGGGGAGASANANGLSNDPGVEGDKKETPLKMTSKSASYEGGTAYNGGGYRAGAGEKKDADGNPFASMFGKDKGRSPSAVPEIDSPASDLFTKISNRYSEVQKRKALMDVR